MLYVETIRGRKIIISGKSLKIRSKILKRFGWTFYLEYNESDTLLSFSYLIACLLSYTVYYIINPDYIILRQKENHVIIK